MLRGRFGALRIRATDGDLEKIAKLVPAEAISVYLGMLNLVKGDDIYQIGASFFLALVVLLVFRTYLASDANTIDWKIVALSCLAYFIWVYNMKGAFEKLIPYNAFIGAAALLLMTYLGPALYEKWTGTPPGSPPA